MVTWAPQQAAFTASGLSIFHTSFLAFVHKDRLHAVPRCTSSRKRHPLPACLAPHMESEIQPLIFEASAACTATAQNELPTTSTARMRFTSDLRDGDVESVYHHAPADPVWTRQALQQAAQDCNPAQGNCASAKANSFICTSYCTRTAPNRPKGRMSVLRLGFGLLLAHGPRVVHVLLYHLIAGRGGGKPLDQIGGLDQEGGIALANRVEERRELGQQEEPFPVTVDKKLGGNRAMQHHGSSHLPVRDHLAQPGIVRVGAVADDGEIVVRRGRPELADDPGARLAHLLFAAQLVELEDDFSIGRGRQRALPLHSHSFHQQVSPFAHGKALEARAPNSGDKASTAR